MVEFSLTEELEIPIENMSSFTLNGGDFRQFLLLLDLDKLFQGIDLQHAAADEYGIIRIDENSNPALASQMKSRLSFAIQAGEDANGDNRLD